jgi:prepilin-type N-terminal cleavage/methylation domain-containing protein
MAIKKNNKGFSLVEVIVAVAIFAILIIPITTQLISAVKTNKTSTKKQYAIEKAEEIMESFKVCELGDTITIADGNSKDYEGDADYDATAHDYIFTKNPSKSSTATYECPDGTKVTYNEDVYECNTISLGKTYESYTATVTVSNLAYAVSTAGYIWDSTANDCKKDASGDYIRTTSASGTVRNLDDSQSAIITGATYLGSSSGVDQNNLDTLAFQYFREAKVDILSNYPVYYSQYTTGADYFASDSFEKHTTIKVTSTGTTESPKYKVQCIVEYTDKTNLTVIQSEYTSSGDNVYKPDSAYGESGVVYEKEFSGSLPPIYLLYTPATYNGVFCLSDYIDVDVSGLKEGDLAKVYVFKSAAEIDSKYADIICEQFGVDSIDDLVYNNPSYHTSQADVKTAVNLTAGVDDRLKLYSNFSIDSANSNIYVAGTDEDENDDTYLYDINVTLTTDSSKDKTEVSGTRGKK